MSFPLRDGVVDPKKVDSLRSYLNKLKAAADEKGVSAQQYFTEDTPKAAVDTAKKVLGDDNVRTFKDPGKE